MIDNPLLLVDSLAIVLAQAAMLARARLSAHPSPLVRSESLRAAEHSDARLLEREAAVLRGRVEMLRPQQRPDCSPAQRLETLQIMRLREWTPVQAAERFVLHPNTIRGWLRATRAGKGQRLFQGAGEAWNKYHNCARLAVHNLRSLFPEPEFGTRTIAAHVLRAGVKISRSTVQRVLREEPVRPRLGRQTALIPADGETPYGLLTPQAINRVWHVDLTTLRVLWLRFTIVAAIDGFSRKIVGAKVYKRPPATRNVLALLRSAFARCGAPSFLITDHGGQFGKRFKAGLKRSGVRHVTGKVRCPAMNGKIERWFRTFKGWARSAVLGLSVPGVQRRVDRYVHWYNHHRPHSALGGRTPQEGWDGVELPKAVPIYARDDVDVQFHVGRRSFAGDPRLPIVDVAVSVEKRKAA